MRFGVHIHHPHGRDREQGAKSHGTVWIDRGLKNHRVDEVPATADELIELAHKALDIALILRRLEKEGRA